MLTRWTLENFKPIRERFDLPTAPLTVLAGLNSSGKSSFLQSILLSNASSARRGAQPEGEEYANSGLVVEFRAVEGKPDDQEGDSETDSGQGGAA